MLFAAIFFFFFFYIKKYGRKSLRARTRGRPHSGATYYKSCSFLLLYNCSYKDNSLFPQSFVMYKCPSGEMIDLIRHVLVWMLTLAGLVGK